MRPSAVLPASPAARSRWVAARRGPRRALDPFRAYAAFVEPEADGTGGEVPVATIFLTNRECPFRCVMCDLWKDTLAETVPPGAIPAQIRGALAELPPARWVKLYNAGSFFDPRAIPPAEYAEIAGLLVGFERVIVECHPAFLGRRAEAFRALLPPAVGLEVAVGLETAHPEVLARLNKGMTLDDFRAGVAWLAARGLPTRAFLLVRPLWLSEAEGVEWACRSLDFAFDCGVETCVLIPTRGGNGAMEALAAAGEFGPPRLASVEAALEHGLRAGRRVFADLWDAERFADCPACGPARIARLRAMNRTQQPAPAVECPACA